MRKFLRRLGRNLDWYWVSFVWWVEVAAVSFPGFPKTWVKRLSKVDSSWVTSRVARLAVEKFVWSEAEFLELAVEGNEYIRDAFASHPLTCSAFLNVLLDDKAGTVRSSALSNPNVNWGEVRRRMGAGEDLESLSIARNPNVPLDLLVQVSRLPYLDGRIATEKLEGMDDDVFARKLREIGAAELVGYPRQWALKALAC